MSTVRQYLGDDEKWIPMPSPEPDMMWNIGSDLKWLDGWGISTSLNASEVCDHIEKLLIAHGYQKENIRFDDYTDQIHGWIRYRDMKWRRIINIVYC